MEVMSINLNRVDYKWVINITTQVGSMLQIGQTLAALKLDDPSQVKTARMDNDTFPTMQQPEATYSSRNRCKNPKSLQRVGYMLNGYIAWY